MKQNWHELSDEEKERLRRKTPIAHDDPTALCTEVGIAAQRKKQAEHMKSVPKKHHPFTPPSSTIYFARAKDDPKKQLAIESERFIDARATACALLGVPEVNMTAVLKMDEKMLPRWQMQWKGSAAGANNLHSVVRLIKNENDDLPWTPLREAKLE